MSASAFALFSMCVGLRMKGPGALLCAVLGIAACARSTGGLDGTGADASAPRGPPPVLVDVLFVIADNGIAIKEKQDRLRASSGTFFDALEGTADYRIAVVSTDVNNRVERSGTFSATYATMAPWELVELDVSMCTTASIAASCFRGPDPEKRIIASADEDKAEAIARFRANADLGSCGSGIKTGLKSTLNALSKTTAGGCNAGFLRPDALLLVVYFADENDVDATPIGDYVTALGHVKDYAKLRIAVITAAENGEPADCNAAQGADCGKMACGPRQPEGSGIPCKRDSDCPGPTPEEPLGESCQVNAMGQKVCLNRAYGPTGGYDPAFCRICDFYHAPDCCDALTTSSPALGEIGRYIGFARAMEDKITAADQKIPKTRCTPPPKGRAACAVESICQTDYAASLERIANTLILATDQTR